MKVAVIGTGYVGLVTGACLSEIGHTVTCVDVDKNKIDKLREGKSPIYEPGIEELIERNASHQRLFFETDLGVALQGAEMAFIAVGTPEGEDGSADLRYVREAATSIAEKLTGSLLVVVKSTVPVGTCDMVEQVLTAALKVRFPAGKAPRVGVASNPEFLKEGTAIGDFMRPDRIVAGIESLEDQKLIRELYNVFVIDDPAKLYFTDRRSSEMIKYASNSMLAVRISFMNELSRLCDRIGADVDSVRRGMSFDTRIGRKFLWAGPGYGGSCFPKDVSALIKTGEKYDSPLTILRATEEANDAQKNYICDKLHRFFKGDLRGKKFAVWGLAFKPGTDDTREAPAERVVEFLVENGASVVLHDPQGAENFMRHLKAATQHVAIAEDAYEALEQTDGLILMTEWPEYKRPSWQKVATLMRGKNIFDFRNQYDRESIKKQGFQYIAVGRPDDMREPRS